MSQREEKVFDAAQYCVAGPLYFVLSAVVAAVMGAGFLAITAFQRVLHH